MTDAGLERDIERALAVEPSAEFLARVRAEIAAQPEGLPWRIAWRWIAAGSAVAAITAAIVLFPPAAPQPGNVLEPAPIASTTTAKTATPQTSLPQTPDSRVRDVTRRRAPSLTSVAKRTPRPEPEVLMAKDEAAALKRFMRGRDYGVVEPSAAGDGPNEVEPIQPPIPIVVAPMAAESPITIAPLGIQARERGVRQ
jgi:hypothetical protein